jgi:DNA-binding GntR family transcriptional regulator
MESTFSWDQASDLDRYRTNSSPEQAARYIRQQIFDGKLRAGAHVPQDEIATILGMSRIPIREALITLERQGWVRIERHRGAFVCAIQPDTVYDHYELYALMYGFAVRRAVERSGPELSKHLEALAVSLPKLVDRPAEFSRVAKAFHDSVVIASRSHRVAVALSTLSRLVPGDFFSYLPAAVRIETKGLQEISRAVKRGDVEGAADAWTRTIWPISRLVVELFESRGLFVESEIDVAI